MGGMVRGVERKEEGKGSMGRQEGRWKKGFLGAHWRILGWGAIRPCSSIMAIQIAPIGKKLL